jgi:hypothetical protein
MDQQHDFGGRLVHVHDDVLETTGSVKDEETELSACSDGS